MPLAPPPAIVSRIQPGPGRHYVLARPEHARDAVRAGDVYVVPLFDGHVSDVEGPLRDTGSARIPYQSWTLGGGTYVGSRRARAFRVVGTGNATVLVVLVAAAYPMRCVSCRTVHYFVSATR